MMVSKYIKMAELVQMNYHILPVISRFGIGLGFGEKTIEHICNENSINCDFFLEIINVFLNDDYFPDENLKKFDISVILDYLKKSHIYFISVKLYEIDAKFNTLINEHTPQIELIKNFYFEFKNELIEHIKYEEEKIFPYINDLISNNLSNYDFSIVNYIENHSNIEEKIFDLKNILIKYLQIPLKQNISVELISDLFDFEKDLQKHQNFEEKVLVPKVIEIENKK